MQEGLDALEDVIYHLETYDVTTVRASTPMYLLSRKIKAMGVKMVLSGEGSDEILGGKQCTWSSGDRNLKASLERLFVLSCSTGRQIVPSRVRQAG